MFKTYEGQAKLSVILSVLGGLATIGAIAVLLKNFDAESFYVNYSPQSLWLPMFGSGVLVGLGAGAVGFFVALHSAGQKRNKQSGLSWLGFFLNAFVLTIMLAACIFFIFTRNAIRPLGA